MNDAFWQAIDQLVATTSIVIDRPKGSKHPKYPHIIYPLDYGYLENTSSADGSGIDLWRGCLREQCVGAIICTVDLMKRDSEIKLLIGCSCEEKMTALAFHDQSAYMKGILINRR